MAKVIKGAGQLAGEPILAGSVVQPPGSMGTGSTGGGAIGKLTKAAFEKRDQGKHGERTSPLSAQQRGFLAVTESRLLVMLVKTGFSHKAVEVLTEVSLAEVADAHFDKGVLSSVTIELHDGTAWQFSAVKIDAGKARAVVETLAGSG